MAATQNTTSALSLSEIKDLIAYAREQKVIAFEVSGVRVQFSALAHEPTPAAPPEVTEAKKKTDDGGAFRFDPGDP